MAGLCKARRTTGYKLSTPGKHRWKNRLILSIDIYLQGLKQFPYPISHYLPCRRLVLGLQLSLLIYAHRLPAPFSCLLPCCFYTPQTPVPPPRFRRKREGATGLRKGKKKRPGKPHIPEHHLSSYATCGEITAE